MKLFIILFISLNILNVTLGARQFLHKLLEDNSVKCHNRGNDIFVKACLSLQKLNMYVYDDYLGSHLLGAVQDQTNRILSVVQERPKRDFKQIEDCLTNFKTGVKTYRREAFLEYKKDKSRSKDIIHSFTVNVQKVADGALHCIAG
uniref:Ribosome-recycling factor, mitochondrial n=1 Tax=Culicoides nubeculosus TaxID=144565 RepID=B9URK2_CULNU|nr:secreted salivary protein [Culicoides nubeculosus]